MAQIQDADKKKEVGDKIRKLIDLINEEIQAANKLPFMKVRIYQGADFGTASSMVSISIYESISL